MSILSGCIPMEEDADSICSRCSIPLGAIPTAEGLKACPSCVLISTTMMQHAKQSSTPESSQTTGLSAVASPAQSNSASPAVSMALDQSPSSSEHAEPGSAWVPAANEPASSSASTDTSSLRAASSSSSSASSSLGSLSVGADASFPFGQFLMLDESIFHQVCEPFLRWLSDPPVTQAEALLKARRANHPSQVFPIKRNLKFIFTMLIQRKAMKANQINFEQFQNVSE
jgi:hypothetical protein